MKAWHAKWNSIMSPKRQRQGRLDCMLPRGRLRSSPEQPDYKPLLLPGRPAWFSPERRDCKPPSLPTRQSEECARLPRRALTLESDRIQQNLGPRGWCNIDGNLFRRIQLLVIYNIDKKGVLTCLGR